MDAEEGGVARGAGLHPRACGRSLPVELLHETVARLVCPHAVEPEQGGVDGRGVHVEHQQEYLRAGRWVVRKMCGAVCDVDG